MLLCVGKLFRVPRAGKEDGFGLVLVAVVDMGDPVEDEEEKKNDADDEVVDDEDTVLGGYASVPPLVVRTPLPFPPPPA